MENWIQDVISKWKAENVELNPPATTEEIDATEAALNFKFPEDFKEFYLQANGFNDYEWQEHMFSFWSLSRIVEEFQEWTTGEFIGFCDFLIMSHCIGFVKNQQGFFKNYGKLENERIAETYKDVVEMINSNNRDIY